MGRIEPVAKLLKPFGGVAFSAPVEPDGDQRQDGQALLRDLHRNASQCDGENQAFQHLKIKIIHANKLADTTPECGATEKIEDENHQNTGGIVIGKAEQSQKSTKKNSADTCEGFQKSFEGFFRFFIQMDHPKTDQQRPQYILVQRIESGTAIHQIERYL